MTVWMDRLEGSAEFERVPRRIRQESGFGGYSCIGLLHELPRHRDVSLQPSTTTSQGKRDGYRHISSHRLIAFFLAFRQAVRIAANGPGCGSHTAQADYPTLGRLHALVYSTLVVCSLSFLPAAALSLGTLLPLIIQTVGRCGGYRGPRLCHITTGIWSPKHSEIRVFDRKKLQFLNSQPILQDAPLLVHYITANPTCCMFCFQSVDAKQSNLMHMLQFL
jgi:hypothetical protein